MSVHDLTAYAISDSVVKDFPPIIKAYDQILFVLEHFRHYIGVELVVTSIEDSKILMKNQLQEAKLVKSTKAKKG